MKITTWSDVQAQISLQKLPYSVLRFNMSLTGVLIDTATGDTLATSVIEAKQVIEQGAASPSTLTDDDGGRTRIGNTPTCEDCEQPLDSCMCGGDESPATLPPDPEESNQRRSEQAFEVLNQYESAFGEAPYGGISAEQLIDLREQNLSDLICDFAHFCDRNGVDMQQVLRRAAMHYRDETGNEGTQFDRSSVRVVPDQPTKPLGLQMADDIASALMPKRSTSITLSPAEVLAVDLMGKQAKAHLEKSDTEIAQSVLARPDLPVRRLTCCCCGESFQGRQFHNQDTGHGMGECCADRVLEHKPFGHLEMSLAEFERTYGIRGYHFDLPKG